MFSQATAGSQPLNSAYNIVVAENAQLPVREIMELPGNLARNVLGPVGGVLSGLNTMAETVKSYQDGRDGADIGLTNQTAADATYSEGSLTGFHQFAGYTIGTVVNYFNGN